MLTVRVETDQAVQAIEAAKSRLRDFSVFFQVVVRPRLLQEFAKAYPAAGLNIRTGRLYDSYVSLSHAEHVSNISSHHIEEGTRVPYAVYVERRFPIVGRIARNQTLLREFARRLGEHVVSGHP